ncbi:16975_t:CDS:2, partial [Dentiscutata erythropus]
TFSSAIPIENRAESTNNLDGCARIHESYEASLRKTKSTLDIKYNDVKDCYLSFPFDLNRASKSIKVFHDDLNSSNVGCEVTHIDSSPALEVITDFAKKNIKNSRDLGKSKKLNLQTEQLADNKILITGENITYIGDFTMVLKIGDIGVIVLDFTNNGGGYIELSQYLNNLFFSQKKASFPRDIKINNITTFLIKQADELNFQLADFAPKSTLSYTTYELFNNSDEYIGNNQYTRVGSFHGACSSACAQTTQYLAEQANFTTISVCGFYNSSMSYSSYPGGSVVD